MRAWVCKELVGEDGLALEEQESPACGPGQVKVLNHCAALNYPDVLITRGQYQFKLDPPFIPGSEFAGVITEVGDGVRDLDAGQRVMVMSGFGAFAEEVVVAPPFQQIHPIPESMSFADAAAFNMVYGTGMHALKQRGHLQPGETLLVLGSAGGCGGAAVEIGKAMGARVIAGASSDGKCAVAARLGADETVNYSREDLRDRVMALTGDQGVDVVFDPVGDALFAQARRCVGWDGRYLVIGFAGGAIPSLEAGLETARNALSVLVGEIPGTLQIPDIDHIPQSGLVLEGIPADLLRRRPDVQRAERELAAQTARVGEAVADLYPKFTLTGSIGLESLKTSNLFESDSGTYSMIPGVRWPIFYSGSIRSNIKIQEVNNEWNCHTFWIKHFINNAKTTTKG